MSPAHREFANEPLEIRIAIFLFVSECKATNEGEEADFADFDPKIGCHGIIPCAIAKRSD